MTTNEDDELPILKVNVIERGGSPRKDWMNCQIGINLQFSADSLASYFFAKWEPIVFDALLVAAAVEFCDKVKKRPKLGWGRDIHLKLPVHDAGRWNHDSVAGSLRRALEFLTGDRWQIEFVKRKKAEPSPQQGLFQLPLAGPLAVVPFSEGLDSRAVSGLMATQLKNGLIRVRLGKRLFDKPKDASGRALPFTAIPYKVPSGGNTFSETSARSRGFKFALLSGIAAYLANAQRIIVPESGQGALGPTLVTVGQSYDDFRNHPAFTALMEVFLSALLGASAKFEFPRLWFTKGETLKAYTDLADSADWVTTRSCWQDNRHSSVDGKRRQCGICAACMLRRLSVHAAGLSEPKGTYVWDDLTARSFESGAAKGVKKIEKVQREYAIAGTLHLDHLAGIKNSPIYSYGLKTSANLLGKALNISTRDAETNLDRLLAQHQKEWKAFMKYLGPDSFINKWTEQAQ
jgi:7-cyano-7-deazaguanine synthase in queuosine biosynthesis